jgi:hypothetical protein
LAGPRRPLSFGVPALCGTAARLAALFICSRKLQTKDLVQGEMQMPRKYSKGASKDVESAMHRKKKGTLKSGPGGKGGKVKSRAQAVAIGLSEARKKGKKVPSKSKSRKK